MNLSGCTNPCRNYKVRNRHEIHSKFFQHITCKIAAMVIKACSIYTHDVSFYYRMFIKNNHGGNPREKFEAQPDASTAEDKVYIRNREVDSAGEKGGRKKEEKPVDTLCELHHDLRQKDYLKNYHNS